MSSKQWVNTKITSSTEIVTFPISASIVYTAASNNGVSMLAYYDAAPQGTGKVKFVPSVWNSTGENAILAVAICIA